ncbi:hypothetical protein BCR37DRAFT_388031 [Protomyces lactucae-debilis]|uniref:SnoaL-like domain-containing protein n=1 Tax=Protomyces lactucae-debilis TaxID=2754530 RepID=A0A1Y2FDU1_PROLT|nr:uncharacterized protein BCR37DRAFT_388031 [Protomyces lactucae-debilis]ORY81015.1 hypothetical protein BCR37DRAFT_388031 [Protomyces lactucae-debilis]
MSTMPNFKSLPTREASGSEKTIIEEVLSLYQCKPTEKAYSHYAENAVFSDPVSIAQGKAVIQSQFNGMPKIFKQSDTKECRVLDDKSKPNAIVLDLTQHYVFKLGNFEKTLNSLITLELQNGMIQRHEEQWDGKPNATAADGFFGKLAEWRKIAGAKLIHAVVGPDPSKV